MERGSHLGAAVNTVGKTEFEPISSAHHRSGGIT